MILQLFCSKHFNNINFIYGDTHFLSHPKNRNNKLKRKTTLVYVLRNVIITMRLTDDANVPLSARSTFHYPN